MLAAGIDEAYIRPRGRVRLAPVPHANTRWRDRLERSVTTIARGLEIELGLVADRATRTGRPVIESAPAARPFPVGCFDGLRVGWVSWYEHGLAQLAPDWSLRPDGRLVEADGTLVTTEQLVANLARLWICDDGGSAERRRHAYEQEVAAARVHALDALAYLDRQLSEVGTLRSLPVATAPGEGDRIGR